MLARLLLGLMLALGGPAVSGCARSAEPATAPTPTAATQFGGTDLAWIEINIAMDEQLLPLLGLVPSRSGSAGVQAVASQVQAVTTAELTELRALHDQAGLPSANPHEGMPMPGMVTPDDVAKAQSLTGKEFDAFVVKAIEAHVEQSQNLAESEDKSGVEPQTRTLALQVLRTRAEVMSTINSIS
ncbi:DUF305 domain-containing protein [Actinoplanes sp. CA-030573]|uniref:DUF305 domain-containing protein n=1 Tax=Actinoplanes sp. CA-030573 TaxID=3239898 RepID=UPI003D8C35E6